MTLLSSLCNSRSHFHICTSSFKSSVRHRIHHLRDTTPQCAAQVNSATIHSKSLSADLWLADTLSKRASGCLMLRTITQTAQPRYMPPSADDSNKLWDKIVSTYNKAQESGAASKMDTSIECLQTADPPVNFILRITASLRDKPKPPKDGYCCLSRLVYATLMPLIQQLRVSFSN